METSAEARIDGLIRVAFCHPRAASQFEAEIGPETTGQHAIDGLVRAGFLDAPTPTTTYVLHYPADAGRTLPLSAALVSSGVGNGEVVSVVQSRGCSCWARRPGGRRASSRLHVFSTRGPLGPQR